MLLHFLPKVLEASDQAVVQGFQLLRCPLLVDANSVCQEGDLEGGEEYLSVLEGCCHGYRGNDKQRIYLQGDEAFKFLNALTVLWVRLDVGVCEESLQRMEPE